MNTTRMLLSQIVVLLALLDRAGAGASAPTDPNKPEAKESFLDMSIEELMDVEVRSTAALTQTSARLAPAAVTTITKEDILASGARSLFELLDIYVPNLQWIRHHWEADHLGLRGIIDDREDKYLLLVNGRVMNERTHFGAMSERDLVLLRDIHHIDIIRGPGSALYGPGAVSMVINIVTENAKTFQGTEVSGRAGAGEEFYAGEFKYGELVPEQDLGVFLYFGAENYVGAGPSAAPPVYAFNFPTRSQYPWAPDDPGPHLPADGYQAGTAYTGPGINRDGATYRDRTPMKFHAEVTKGDWDFWARYTQGGEQFATDPGTLMHYPWGWGDWVNNYECSSGYQQVTTFAGYEKELGDDLTVNAAVSYETFDFERILQGSVADAHREDEFYGKLLFNWQAAPDHKLAFGSEVAHDEFGLPTFGWPDGPPVSSLLGSPMPRWNTDTISFLGEHQWTISEQWSTFLGARLDEQTYVKNMFSPRAALVHTPDEQNTWKLIWSRSVRANFAEELKAADLRGDDNRRPEKLDSVEVRYERKNSAHLDTAASVFIHYDLELLTWSGADVASVGTQREFGFELEANYHTDRTRLGISHGFTKLYSFHLEPGMSTVNTSEPYGYGDDLANWSNHITKIVGRYKLDPQWTLDGSLRIYWGFPGLESYNEYQPGAMGPGSTPAIEPGWEKGYRGDYFLDLGLQYQPRKNLIFRVDGYNLLGIFDSDLNKRNYYTSLGDYRSEAAAVAVWVIYQF